MIIGTFKDKDPYNGLDRGSLVRFALDEARKIAAAPFVAGTTLFFNDSVKINSQEVEMRPLENAALEAHRRFIDIHVPLSGPERLGWSPTGILSPDEKGYNTEDDIIFFEDKPQIVFDIYPGQFAIFFPDDAHAPIVGEGTLRKLCIKIPV